MSQNALTRFSVHKVDDETITRCNDHLATEEPMEIRLLYGNNTLMVEKSISVTMRSPGNDFELAKGFLFTEGIYWTENYSLHSSKYSTTMDIHQPGWT